MHDALDGTDAAAALGTTTEAVVDLSGGDIFRAGAARHATHIVIAHMLHEQTIIASTRIECLG